MLLEVLTSTINIIFTGPAPTDFTNRIHQLSEKIDTYFICKTLKCDFSETGTHIFKIGDEGREFVVDVIDPVDDYLEMMKDIFDFNMIKMYLKGNKILLNSLHGGKLKLLIANSPINFHYSFLTLIENS